MPKTDTDDVLDFINSLPDLKSGTPQPKENKEELLDFLDELTTSSKTPTQAKFEPKKRKEKEVKEEKKTQETTTESTTETEEEQPALTLSVPVQEGAEVDPLASILSWWSKEGSSKVSSLWGSITSNAQNLTEQTYQLASNTSNTISQQRQKFLAENSGIVQTEQILNISNRLNGILSTMSQQIKDGLISDEDELLNILLVYDFDLPQVDKLAQAKFNRVMSQVEGGIKVSVDNFNHRKEDPGQVTLNLFSGKIIDGEKLCYANLDAAVKDYTKVLQLEKETRPEAEENGDKSEETEEKTDKGSDKSYGVNKSNIFISIQPITTHVDGKTVDPERPIIIEHTDELLFAFTLILKDITNNITIITKTQAFPFKWAQWLAGITPEFSELFEDEEASEPGEWVKEWVRDGLALSFGVMAQEYVTRRMGI